MSPDSKEYCYEGGYVAGTEDKVNGNEYNPTEYYGLPLMQSFFELVKDSLEGRIIRSEFDWCCEAGFREGYHEGYEVEYYNYPDKNETVLMIGQSNGVIAKLVGEGIPVIIVENEGKFPVRLNHYTDEYYYITSDDKYYLLPASSYDVATINPDNFFHVCITGDVQVYNEFIKKYRNKEIKGILMILNSGKLEIELQQIE